MIDIIIICTNKIICTTIYIYTYIYLYIYSSYFNNCPIITVPGRVYPVSIKYTNECNKLIKDTQLVTSHIKDNKNSNYNSNNNYNKKNRYNNNNNKPATTTTTTGDEEGQNSDPSTSNIKLIPPIFDPEYVTELIIRIIQSHTIPSPTYENLTVTVPSTETQNISTLDQPSIIPSSTTDSNTHTLPTTTATNNSNNNSANNNSGRGQCILVFLSGVQAIQQVSRSLKGRIAGGCMPAGVTAYVRIRTCRLDVTLFYSACRLFTNTSI